MGIKEILSRIKRIDQELKNRESEVENTKISEIDVIYRRQCYEKDTLTICKKATQEHIDFSFEKPDGTVATLIRMKIEKNA